MCNILRISSLNQILGPLSSKKSEEQRARGPLALENGWGRASGGGKLAVNGLRQMGWG